MGAIIPLAAEREMDPDITQRLPRQPVASVLGTKPTEEELAKAIKAMANEKKTGTDGLPVQLLKFGQQNRAILIEIHRLIVFIWRVG